MKNLLEFEVVVYLKDDKSEEELSSLENLGISLQQQEEESDDKIVKYSFIPDSIIEIRQSFVKYNDRWEDAVICGFTKNKYNFETPPLLTTYEEFKTKLDEYHKEESKTD